MATLLESVGLFSDISEFLLPFLLVFAVVYGILMKTKFLSERADVNAMVSLAIGMIIVLSGAGKFLTTITPLFAVFFILIFMLFLIFLFFGIEKDIKSIIVNNRMIAALIVIIFIIFVFYSLGTLYGSALYLGAQQETGAVSGGANATINQSAPIGPEVCDFNRLSGQAAVSCLL